MAQVAALAPEGDEEAVTVSTLPVLRVLCDLRIEVLLLCGIAVAQECEERRACG
jgi:hypothetical protein